ncbi:MAG: hypothetical protein ACE5DM_03405, partial [Candidatus Nanoarchaeia archaeon]
MNIGNRLGLAAATTGLVALTAAQPATADISNCSDRTLTPTCFAKILEEPYSSDKDAKVALEVRQTDWLRAFQLLWQKPALRKRIH